MQIRPTDERWTVANDEAGIRTHVEQLRVVAPTQVVLEATGLYELAAVSALAAAAGGYSGPRNAVAELLNLKLLSTRVDNPVD